MPAKSKTHAPVKPSSWKKLVAPYQVSDTRKSVWQLVNSLIPFLGLWVLAYLSLGVGYWLTLPLSILAAGFVVRMFIIQHDCGHGSFFNSRKANDGVGMFCSLFTWTPYHYWQKGHAIHHASAGNLQQRGIGDVYTMTVNEYLQLSRWGKFQYRLYRNPLVLFMLVPTFLFVVMYRVPTSQTKALKRVEASVYWTDLAIALLVAAMLWLVGWQAFLLVQIPITIMAATAGTWLFFVQHQFEDTYWASEDNWDYTLVALQGSSYYKLPKILQWFTGNIGFHHIHHLSPRIPNYLLEKCHEENPPFQETVVLTLRSSFHSVTLSLWDEEQKKLLSFKQLKHRQPQMAKVSQLQTP